MKERKRTPGEDFVFIRSSAEPGLHANGTNPAYSALFCSFLPVQGECRPASVSQDLKNDLARGSLGFMKPNHPLLSLCRRLSDKKDGLFEVNDPRQFEKGHSKVA